MFLFLYLLLCLQVKSNLNEWNLLVDGRPESFCGQCAVPENWTLVQPSLIIDSFWPLNFTLWSETEGSGDTNITLSYRRRQCNLSAHWINENQNTEIYLPQSEDLNFVTFSMEIHSGLSKIELLTDDCTLMLINVSSSRNLNSTSSSHAEGSSSGQTPPITEKLILARIIVLSIVPGMIIIAIFVTIIVYFYRRRRYQTFEMDDLRLEK